MKHAQTQHSQHGEHNQHSRRAHNNRDKLLMVILLVGIAAAFIVGLEMGRYYSPTQSVYVDSQSNQPAILANAERTLAAQNTKISLLLPAIKQNGQGAVAQLDVEIKNGSGRSFLRVDGTNPVVDQNTQDSIKLALITAQGYSEKTRQNLRNSDLLFTFSGTMGSVGGESAGAAMSVATIALLNGKKLKPNIAITGSISENGSIGEIGGVLEKAKALKNAGITTFLVPVGESITTRQEVFQNETCNTRDIGNGIVQECRTSRNVESTPVNISQEVGITVIEVNDAYQAYRLMVAQ